MPVVFLERTAKLIKYHLYKYHNVVFFKGSKKIVPVKMKTPVRVAKKNLSDLRTGLNFFT